LGALSFGSFLWASKEKNTPIEVMDIDRTMPLRVTGIEACVSAKEYRKEKNLELAKNMKWPRPNV
jgi:hypothetical protein